MNFQIRLATVADLPAINAIYNFYVITSTCTYQEEPTSDPERAEWFAQHGSAHPITVAAAEDGEIVGWASLSRFHPRSAYRMTVEDSIYILGNKRRQGLGWALLSDLLERAKGLGYRQMVGLVSAEQTGSLELHKRAGFVEAGRLIAVGYKFGRWLDMVSVQKAL